MFFIVGIWEEASTAGLRSGHLSPWETLQKQEFNTQNRWYLSKHLLVNFSIFSSLDLDTFDFLTSIQLPKEVGFFPYGSMYSQEHQTTRNNSKKLAMIG